MSCEVMVAWRLPRARKIAEEGGGRQPRCWPTIRELERHVGVRRQLSPIRRMRLTPTDCGRLAVRARAGSIGLGHRRLLVIR